MSATLAGLTGWPPAGQVNRRPDEWQRILGVVVLVPTGWGDDPVFGLRDWADRICRAEFEQRAAVSVARRIETPGPCPSPQSTS